LSDSYDSVFKLLGFSKDDLQEKLNRLAEDMMSTPVSVPRVLNTRNLTDMRTRVGFLLEYSAPHVIKKLLEERPRTGKRCKIKEGGHVGYLISNQFGDFCIRRGDFTVWVEVKCLDIDAEEYAANLSTPMAWIPPTGFLMIMLYRVEDTDQVRHPTIIDIGVFRARTIAKLRDFGWLDVRNKQILIDGASYRTGSGIWKREEGNMGKIGRIARACKKAESSNYFTDKEKKELCRFRNFLLQFEKQRAEHLGFRIRELLGKYYRYVSLDEETSKQVYCVSAEGAAKSPMRKSGKYSKQKRPRSKSVLVVIKYWESKIARHHKAAQQWYEKYDEVFFISSKFEVQSDRKQEPRKKVNLMSNDELADMLLS